MGNMDPIGSARQEKEAKKQEKMKAAMVYAEKKKKEDAEKALKLEEAEKAKRRSKFGGRGFPMMEATGEGKAGVTKTLLGG